MANAVNSLNREAVSSALECPIGIPYGRAASLPIGSEKAATLTAFSTSRLKPPDILATGGQATVLTS
jgi:class 3 adenylate cyclase